MEVKKKIPMRRCVGCGETKEKRQLLRIVRSPDGEVNIDLTGKKSGRGAYICKNVSCLRKARKNKRLEQNLETSISDDVYSRLESQIGANGN